MVGYVGRIWGEEDKDVRRDRDRHHTVTLTCISLIITIMTGL